MRHGFACNPLPSGEGSEWQSLELSVGISRQFFDALFQVAVHQLEYALGIFKGFSAHEGGEESCEPFAMVHTAPVGTRLD